MQNREHFYWQIILHTGPSGVSLASPRLIPELSTGTSYHLPQGVPQCLPWTTYILLAFFGSVLIPFSRLSASVWPSAMRKTRQARSRSSTVVTQTRLLQIAACRAGQSPSYPHSLHRAPTRTRYPFLHPFIAAQVGLTPATGKLQQFTHTGKTLLPYFQPASCHPPSISRLIGGAPSLPLRLVRIRSLRICRSCLPRSGPTRETLDSRETVGGEPL